VRSVPRLHAVTDDDVTRRPDFLERVRAVARAGGARVALQLRGRLEGRAYVDLADSVRETLHPHRTRLLVNDRLDVARVVNAAGVHLPESGIPPAAARAILGPDALIGRSVHDVVSLGEPDDALDYLTLGPIWETASHPERGALGVSAIARRPLPLIAIGGVTPERAAHARRAGAHGVAAIRAIWDAEDPGAAVRAFLLSLEA
jgi:thiamine-phosphate diphosphorylase